MTLHRVLERGDAAPERRVVAHVRAARRHLLSAGPTARRRTSSGRTAASRSLREPLVLGRARRPRAPSASIATAPSTSASTKPNAWLGSVHVERRRRHDRRSATSATTITTALTASVGGQQQPRRAPASSTSAAARRSRGSWRASTGTPCTASDRQHERHQHRHVHVDEAAGRRGRLSCCCAAWPRRTRSIRTSGNATPQNRAIGSRRNSFASVTSSRRNGGLAMSARAVSAAYSYRCVQYAVSSGEGDERVLEAGLLDAQLAARRFRSRASTEIDRAEHVAGAA